MAERAFFRRVYELVRVGGTGVAQVVAAVARQDVVEDTGLVVVCGTRRAAVGVLHLGRVGDIYSRKFCELGHGRWNGALEIGAKEWPIRGQMWSTLIRVRTKKYEYHKSVIVRLDQP